MNTHSDSVSASDRARRLRLVGVALPTPEQEQSLNEGDRQRLRRAVANGPLDPTDLRAPVPRVVPVLQDDDGRFVAILGSGPDQRLVEIADPEASVTDPFRVGQGGYLGIDALQGMPRPGQAAGVPPSALAGVASQLAQQALLGSAGEGAPTAEGQKRDIGDMITGMLQGSVLGMGQQLLGDQIVGSILGTDTSMGAMMQQFCVDPQAASGGLLGKLLDPANGLSLLADLGGGALFNAWTVDDTSSMGEQLAHKYAQELLALVKEQVMASITGGGGGKTTLEKALTLIEGTPSSASIPVGRLADPDDAAGTIKAGAPTVLVNGQLAARLGDAADMTIPSPDVGAIIMGNPTVLLQTRPAAGKGHMAVGELQGTPATITMGSPNVLMGAAMVVVAPRLPEGKDTAPSSSDQNSNGSGTSQTPEGQEAETHEGGGPGEPEADAQGGAPGGESGQGSDAPSEQGDQPGKDHAGEIAKGAAQYGKDRGKVDGETVEAEARKLGQSHDDVAVSAKDLEAKRGSVQSALGKVEKELSDLERIGHGASHGDHLDDMVRNVRMAELQAERTRLMNQLRSLDAGLGSTNKTLSQLGTDLQQTKAVGGMAGLLEKVANVGGTLMDGLGLYSEYAASQTDPTNRFSHEGRAVGTAAGAVAGAVAGQVIAATAAKAGAATPVGLIVLGGMAIADGTQDLFQFGGCLVDNGFGAGSMSACDEQVRNGNRERAQALADLFSDPF